MGGAFQERLVGQSADVNDSQWKESGSLNVCQPSGTVGISQFCINSLKHCQLQQKKTEKLVELGEPRENLVVKN